MAEIKRELAEYRWTVDPKTHADVALNRLIESDISSELLERDLSALRTEAEVLTDVVSRFAAEGRGDEKALAAVQELRNVHAKILITQEELSHKHALEAVFEEVSQDPAISPHFERLVGAKAQVAQEILNDPEADEGMKSFFGRFVERFGRSLK